MRYAQFHPERMDQLAPRAAGSCTKPVVPVHLDSVKHSTLQTRMQRCVATAPKLVSAWWCNTGIQNTIE